MVFSQTSQKTQSVLKVVDINLLKKEKNQQVTNTNGVVEESPNTTTEPMASTSFSEVFLKEEPDFDEMTMYRNTDSELFQDLGLWCSTPTKEEHPLPTDLLKTVEECINTDILNTQYSPQGWEAIDSYSPMIRANDTTDLLSTNYENCLFIDNNYTKSDSQKYYNMQRNDYDIQSLPVVIDGLESSYTNTHEPRLIHNTNYTEQTIYTPNKIQFIDNDNLDMKVNKSNETTGLNEADSDDVIISEYVVNELKVNKPKLLLDVVRAHEWSGDVISTPEVLSYVEQLEKQDSPSTHPSNSHWPSPSTTVELTNLDSPSSSRVEYDPSTPKNESHAESDDEDSRRTKKRKRYDSDSDETYTPYGESSPRKYKRRKSNVPIKDMIMALEEAQTMTKTRRGRPPKRRDSNVSSICSADTPHHETKYREIRDKNNEASKRSRMNRKLKELQMEQLALDLEEKNKKLQVKAELLEEMTKRLKDALMSAILKH